MNKYLDKIMEKLMAFANLKSVIALKDGFLLTMPVTLVGSIFLLIANFPVTNWNEIMSGMFGENWAIGLKQVSGSTFDIIAIVAVIGIAYAYAKIEDCDPISNSILALVSFLIVTNSFTVSKGGETVTGVIPKAWINGNGIIAAIIVGLLVSKIFCFFIKRKITFKMPEGVPDGVANAFAALIPGFIIMLISMIVFQVCKSIADLSFTEIIFKGLQIPLQKLSDTLPGGIIIIGLMSVLFWAGIHGPNIVNGIVSPLLIANAMSNQAVIDSGQQLIAGENAKIITKQLIENFAKFGGTGITLGLLISALLVAKSAQLRSISKMSFVPGLFNVNEPVIFGLPIVFNPIMLAPFVIVPIGALIITYVSITIGFLQPFSGLILPWTTPPLISGFLLGGIPGAVVQLIIIVFSTAVYYPFVKSQDKILLENERLGNE